MSQQQDSQRDTLSMALEIAGMDAHAQAIHSQYRQPDTWDINQYDGQLAIDVIDMQREVVVLSTMAGASAEKIEVFMHNDLLTIRGERPCPVDADAFGYDMVHSECFWGTFSRTVVLPVDVSADTARAEYKNGVLMVRIAKQHHDKKIPVIIVDE